MSSIYVIAVLMLILDPAHIDGPNVFEVTSADGKPLHFETPESCMEYAHENSLNLARAAIQDFMPKPTMVQGIVCVKKPKQVGV